MNTKDTLQKIQQEESPKAMYRAFRGRDPSVEPLLIQRGLKPVKPAHKSSPQDKAAK